MNAASSNRQVSRVLFGRDNLIAELKQHLIDRVSVLLVGPPGVGKSALIDALGPLPLVDIVDPFERVSCLHAAQLRRRLDRGATMLAAARTPHRSGLGAVGRILWRFRIVRVRPLSNRDIARIVQLSLQKRRADCSGAEQWIDDIASVANGLPARACAFAEAGCRYWERHRVLPTVEWTVVDALTAPLGIEHVSQQSYTPERYQHRRVNGGGVRHNRRQ